MNGDATLRTRIHQALDPTVRPAPQLAAIVMERVRRARRQAAARSRVARVGRAAGVFAAAALVAAVVLASHQATRHGPPPADQGYRAVPASPGALVAWLSTQDGYVGIDPNGRTLASIQAPAILRSADGRRLYAVSTNAVNVYSADSANVEESIARRGAGLLATLSPDGRYLAAYDADPAGATLELIDLQAGRSAAILSLGTTLSSDGPMYLLASAQAAHVYVFTSVWQHPAVADVGFDGTALRLEQNVRDGQPGHALPGCNGEGDPNSPSGPPERLLPDGVSIVSFCPGDGLVSWFDLARLTIAKQVQVPERNPFWLSPIFSPDGTMLYLHESGTGRVTAVDLHARAISSSVTLRPATAFDPAGWLADLLFPPALAGGIPRTAVISQDGTYLYATGSFGGPSGIWAVHLPDLQPVRSFAGAPGDSVWLSGDGRVLFALVGGSQDLSILHLDSGTVSPVRLATPGYDFLAPSPAT